MTLKLSNEARKQIIRNAIEMVFKSRESALAEEENVLATQGYDSLYPPLTVRRMDALPAEFFNQKSEIWVLADDGYKAISLKSSRRVAAVDCCWHKPFWPAGAAIVADLLARKRKLDQDKSKLKSELNGFLNGITTVTKLRQVWPDGEEYYRWLLDDTVKNPLMVRPDTVNEMILAMGEV